MKGDTRGFSEEVGAMRVEFKVFAVKGGVDWE